MTPTLAALAALVVAPVTGLPTAVWQLAPEVRARFDGDTVEMTLTRPRAVVLIHGLLLHPLRPDKAARPVQHDWQSSKADLVKALASDFDVYGFGYAQTVPVDAVIVSPGLATLVRKLKAAKYTDIVLVGHSAGGLIARQFVERFPEAGVTKVVQVGSPNTGSAFAAVAPGVLRGQAPFVRSLGPKYRFDPEAGCHPLPDGVGFCCVVCKVRGIAGDSLVSLDSQWPDDLRAQGVPAALVAVSHVDAMKSAHAVAVIAELAREKVVRWNPEQIDAGRTIVFGKDADAAAVKKGGSLGKLVADR